MFTHLDSLGFFSPFCLISHWVSFANGRFGQSLYHVVHVERCPRTRLIREWNRRGWALEVACHYFNRIIKLLLERPPRRGFTKTVIWDFRTKTQMPRCMTSSLSVQVKGGPDLPSLKQGVTRTSFGNHPFANLSLSFQFLTCFHLHIRFLCPALVSRPESTKL